MVQDINREANSETTVNPTVNNGAVEILNRHRCKGILLVKFIDIELMVFIQKQVFSKALSSTSLFNLYCPMASTRNQRQFNGSG